MASRAKPRKPYATIIALIVVAGYYFLNGGANPPSNDSNPLPDTTIYDARSDGAMIEASGVVTKVLPDDDDGSKHQRFIIRLDSGQTLLVAHNIDLAARVPDLKRGDSLNFRGQFEMNNRGGVIHWTHHDPRGQHPEGWIEHAGKRYR